MSPASASPVAHHAVVVEIVRSGFVEGHHHGSVAILGRDGEVEWSLGDVTSPVLPRSCNKPVQALGMLRAGLGEALEQVEVSVEREQLLALACASHSGEEFHVAGARRVLGLVGLDESALQTPADLPIGDAERDAWLREGREPAPVAMNCSGKHAAMLATCAVNGWDTTTYLDASHPLQRSIAATFADLTGEEVPALAVDGCGAPLLPTSLTGLARAFRRLATAAEGPERRVADAIRSHPTWVSGTTRDEAVLLRAVPGAIGKAGAESCYAVALPDGRAVATKCDDGSARARPVMMAAALDRMGLSTDPGVDVEAMRGTGRAPLLGGGRPVGELRATY